MPLTNTQKLRMHGIIGEVPEAAVVEAGANGVEALPVTMDNIDDHPDLAYSATAEDLGTAGNLDGEPGVIYSGPVGGFIRVKVSTFDLVEHAIAPPEATDKVALAVFKNSEIQDFGDEGLVVQTEAAVEHNIDTIVGPLKTNDVIRIGITTTGEVGEVDYDLAPGECSFT